MEKKTVNDKLKISSYVCEKRDLVHSRPLLVSNKMENKFRCTDCGYSSYNKHYLKQHVDLVHHADRPFKCPFCDYAGKRSHSLKEHLVVHSNAKPHTCCYCNAAFSKKGHLTSHIKMHAIKKEVNCGDYEVHADPYIPCPREKKTDKSSQVYVCEVCEYSTRIKCDIESHMLSHDCINVFRCYGCNYMSIHMDEIMDHVKIHGPTAGFHTNIIVSSKHCSDQNKVMIKCTECGFSTENREKLKVHMLKHLNLLPGQNTDEKAGPKHDSLIKISTSATQIKQQNKSKLFCCTECKFTTPESHIFLTHMLSHKIKQSTSRTDSCVVKDNVVTQVTENVVNNTQNTVPAKSFNSDFTHDPAVGVYVCSICGYTCEHQRTIKAHIWKHTGHKDVDYPMFQNGPLSVYESAPHDKALKNTTVNEKCQIDTDRNLNADSSMSNNAINSPKLIELLKVKPPNANENKSRNPVESIQKSQGVLPKDNHVVSGKIAKDHSDSPTVVSYVPKSNSTLSTVNREVNAHRDMTNIKGNHRELHEKQTQISESVDITNHQQFKKQSENQKLQEQLTSMEHTEEGASCVNKLANRPIERLDSANVVVQTIHETFPIPKITMSEKQASPKGHRNSDENVDTSNQCTNEVTVGSTQEKNVSDEVILDESIRSPPVMSYLKKPLDSNAAISPLNTEHILGQEGEGAIMCQTGIARQEEVVTEDPNSNTSSSNDNKQKSGICSSLLAVIEQLRERSRSESDGENPCEDMEISEEKPSRKRKRQPSFEDGQERHFETIDNVERVNENEGFYRCKLCHYSSVSGVLMKSHMRMHKTKKPFECSLCDFLADSSQTLQAHMLQHCKMRTFQCKLCSSVFNYKSQLRAHMRAHKDADALVYNTGDFETNNQAVLQNDLQTHGNKDGYVCINCKVLFNDKEEFTGHRCRNPSKILQCEDCSFTTSSDDSMQKHRKVHTKAYKCELCEFACSTSAMLNNHSQSHTEEKSLNCEMCDFVAMSTRSLKSHMKRHINDQRFVSQPLEQYKCSLCGYVCHHLPSLKSHMWRHASDNNYCYQTTNKVINAAIDFKQVNVSPDQQVGPDNEDQNAVVPDHVMMRNDEQGTPKDTTGQILSQTNQNSLSSFIVFRCCQCGFETLDKGSLNEHMKAHADVIQMTLDVNKTKTNKLT